MFSILAGFTRGNSMKDNLEDIQNIYRDKELVKNYEKVRFSTLLGKLVDKREKALIKKIVEKKKPGMILEIACGTGRITSILRGFRGIAIDSSSEMIKVAERTVNSMNWSFQEGNATELGFKEKFDIVVSFRLLRHLGLDEQKKVFLESKKALKKDGLLIFDALNCDRGVIAKGMERLFLLGRFLKAFFKMERVVTVYDFYYRYPKLKQVLEECGFELAETHPVANRYWYLFLVHSLQKLIYFDLSKNTVKRSIETDKAKASCLKGNLQWLIVARKR